MDLLFPVRGESLGQFVVTGDSVDTGFHKNKPEFGVSVLPEFLEMFSDGNSLFDQMVQIFGDFGRESC